MRRTLATGRVRAPGEFIVRQSYPGEVIQGGCLSHRSCMGFVPLGKGADSIIATDLISTTTIAWI